MQSDAHANISFPKPVRNGLRRVYAKLASFKTSDFVNERLFAPSTYLLNRNGKLMRPTLVLIGAYVLGSNPIDFVDLAVASELLHTSSLIHDDMIDDDMVRRGSASVHVKYGGKVALLAGDALISKAVSLTAQYGERVLKSMTNASMDMCAGEVVDYEFQNKKYVPSLEQYLEVAFLKSASLIGACLNSAAVYGKYVSAKKLYESGTDLGMAFQIRDDIFDFASDNGKGRGGVVGPNVITSIQKEWKMDRTSAIAKAIELNNYYIEKSKARMKGMNNADLLSKYAEFIRVKEQ